jgi:hypothetical protein
VVLRLFNEELVYESRAILVIGPRRVCTSISLFLTYFNVLVGLCLLVSGIVTAIGVFTCIFITSQLYTKRQWLCPKKYIIILVVVGGTLNSITEHLLPNCRDWTVIASD